MAGYIRGGTQHGVKSCAGKLAVERGRGKGVVQSGEWLRG